MNILNEWLTANATNITLRLQKKSTTVVGEAAHRHRH
jgi:hypothetical protein